MKEKNKFEQAFQVALKARKFAYAPYSKFQVGAALILENDEIISGCNVENASYGGTVCAERSAIFSAISQGKRKFQSMVLVTDPLAVPCGLCLQVMAEFFSPKTKIYICDLQGVKKEIEFKDLLPHTFGPDSLK